MIELYLARLIRGQEAWVLQPRGRRRSARRVIKQQALNQVGGKSGAAVVAIRVCLDSRRREEGGTEGIGTSTSC